MKEITVQENEAGQRLDKLLAKYLREAPKSFLYKMLRKKNITLNGKKASGSELTAVHDVVRIYLSEETYGKFAGERQEIVTGDALDPSWILYEDRHILLLNKPAGILSQKSQPQDISINEMLIAYLLQTGGITKEELQTFHPSVCNRLDRNTSGLMIAGKSLAGLQEMSRILKERSVHKYYQTVSAGCLTDKQRIKGYLLKDTHSNQVKVLAEATPQAKPIVTEYTPLLLGKDATLLEVWLITGRSHQIRAHLASIGHPVVGDVKYGSDKINQRYRTTYGVRHQLLHASRIVMPQIEGELSYLSGRTFTAPLPEVFEKIKEGMREWQPGIPAGCAGRSSRT